MTPSRSARAGAVLWALSVQFFVAQGVVQSAWTTPFSVTRNYISDLGNTTCGPFRVGTEIYVCSPWHAWMNVSFVVQGVLVALGAALVRPAFPRVRAATVALVLVALAGPGMVAVGLYPEDVNLAVHKLGAGLQFISGNLGVVALGGLLVGAHRRRILGAVTLALGLVGSLATLLFAFDVFLAPGIGGMERLAAYPLPVWLVIAGIALLGRPVD